MIVATCVLGAALLMMGWERLRPGRPLPRVGGWWPRVLLLNGAQAGAVYLAGVVWEPWMQAQRAWSADSLGLLGGGLVGYLTITFIYYWWHRARHEVPFLWRWFHQVHHSPARLEVVTSFYKHPFELVANGVLSSAILYLLVGLGPAAATITVLMTGLAELVYHWNVVTPRWIGPFFQRPEMHCVHHEEGSHRYNYADLPVWDLLFGTYRNPERFEARCGFGAGVEERLPELLVGRDLSTRAPTPPTAGAGPRWGRSAALILVLGLGQMGAAAAGAPRLQGLLAATGASPAPKVFSAVRGLETYSSGFDLEVEYVDGGSERIALTPERYASLRGPYARRNAFGAAVAYGPVLAADERMQALLASVSQHALCGDAPLLRELGLEPASVARARIRVIPAAGTMPDPDLPLALEAECAR